MKLIILFFLASLCFSGCFLNRQPEEITFDNSEPLSLIPDVQWAVIKDPYAAFREEAGWESPVKSHCRRGEIYQITGNKNVVNTGGITEKWICANGLWLPESSVTVCYNRFNAKTVAEQLLK